MIYEVSKKGAAMECQKATPLERVMRRSLWRGGTAVMRRMWSFQSCEHPRQKPSIAKTLTGGKNIIHQVQLGEETHELKESLECYPMHSFHGLWQNHFGYFSLDNTEWISGKCPPSTKMNRANAATWTPVPDSSHCWLQMWLCSDDSASWTLNQWNRAEKWVWQSLTWVQTSAT